MNKKDWKTWSKAKKAKFIKIAKEHQKADRFIQGKWLQDEKVDEQFRGCFYGCMTQSEDNTLEKATELMNIPAWIIYVSEKIFEGLPAEEAIKFPLELLERIPTTTDTEQMWKDWHYKVLMDEEHGQYKYCGENEECKKAVKQCAMLFKEDVISEKAVESARLAAESARSAAWSAWSAAWSAWSTAESAESEWSAARANHYIWLRDTMYELLENLSDNKEEGKY